MSDDRTARAQLRDAAIAIVAESGASALTARGVADRAGLSAGLIRHHFGSMSDLLMECDRFVAATIKRLKERGIRQTPPIDVLTIIRQSDEAHLMGYLALRLADSSPHIDTLVDALVDDAAKYMAEGTDAGLFLPTSNERKRAALITIFTLGSLVMHHHLHRLLGVDIRSADLASQPGFADYLRIQMEVFTGVVSPTLAAQYQATVDTL